MPSRTIASLALACASLADAFAPAPSTRRAPLRHAPRRSLVARSSASGVFGAACPLAVARTPEGQQAAADAAALEAAGIDLEGRRACTLARTAAALKQ